MEVGIKFDIITHHFMLEFVDSDLYFVQDKNNFINLLLRYITLLRNLSCFLTFRLQEGIRFELKINLLLLY